MISFGAVTPNASQPDERKRSVARALLQLCPAAARWRFRMMVMRMARRRYAKLSLREAFRRVYATNAWGSGSGSAGHVEEGAAYVAAVRQFVAQRGVKRVVDAGCGDFFIGSQIAPYVDEYIGLDIVPEIVERNRTLYPGVRFECVDLSKDDLPEGDLCLVKQVFQHLSNAEIARCLRNLSRYPLLLVSEHMAPHNRIANQDKPHGPDIRLYDGSSVVLSAPPFNVPCSDFLETGSGWGIVRTVLIENPTGAAPRRE